MHDCRSPVTRQKKAGILRGFRLLFLQASGERTHHNRNYLAGVWAAGASAAAGAAGAAAGAGAVVGAGAGAVVAAGAGAIPERVTGVLIAKEAQMLITQMKMARLQVAFSMKSVVLR